VDSIIPTPSTPASGSEEAAPDHATPHLPSIQVRQKIAVPYQNARTTRSKFLRGDLQGRILEDRYRLTFPLGRGGMSTVYLARDFTCGRHYAIKVLHRELVERSRYRRRFFNEIDAARRIDHPAVVRMFELGEIEDGRLFLVMEYVRGICLKRLIAQGPVPAQKVIPIVFAVADGLRAAHSRGVVHRDLKPGNVLLPRGPGESAVAKIVDFGIARIAGGPRLTRSSEVIGTPVYLSPEQATGDPIDHRTDIYSLDVLMYEMLTGLRLFDGRDPERLLNQHVREQPVPMVRRRPDLDISPVLDELVMSCLAKKPEHRPYDMSRVMAVLSLLDASGGYLN